MYICKYSYVVIRYVKIFLRLNTVKEKYNEQQNLEQVEDKEGHERLECGIS